MPDKTFYTSKPVADWLKEQVQISSKECYYAIHKLDGKGEQLATIFYSMEALPYMCQLFHLIAVIRVKPKSTNPQ